MATTAQQSFVLNALDLDGVDVSQTDDGEITAARDLTNDRVELDDVLDLADEHDLQVRNVITDMQSAETRVVLGGGAA
ncbi:hypothetical protein [Haloarcula argentinensis]|uniref:Uncharacterized protein n=1 Tax=Haloarcula argentinensis TaxID=43776 RepID=A0ABU2F697_HALAR|nr:hypothetical protein [Haloarcula argentinensis]MDS0256059.1 hypothetical protein [Haloarcula argentinensis]